MSVARSIDDEVAVPFKHKGDVECVLLPHNLLGMEQFQKQAIGSPLS
jgi:hypothetical protein